VVEKAARQGGGGAARRGSGRWRPSGVGGGGARVGGEITTRLAMAVVEGGGRGAGAGRGGGWQGAAAGWPSATPSQPAVHAGNKRPPEILLNPTVPFIFQLLLCSCQDTALAFPRTALSLLWSNICSHVEILLQSSCYCSMRADALVQ
jgi:hypothetical protein